MWNHQERQTPNSKIAVVRHSWPNHTDTHPLLPTFCIPVHFPDYLNPHPLPLPLPHSLFKSTLSPLHKSRWSSAHPFCCYCYWIKPVSTALKPGFIFDTWNKRLLLLRRLSPVGPQALLKFYDSFNPLWVLILRIPLLGLPLVEPKLTLTHLYLTGMCWVFSCDFVLTPITCFQYLRVTTISLLFSFVSSISTYTESTQILTGWIEILEIAIV